MTLIVLFTAAWLALSLAASVFWTGSLWGLAGWGTVSFTWGTILAIVVFVYALVRRRAAGGTDVPEAPSRLERAVPWLAPAAFLLIAWLLHARHDLVGESGAVSRAIAGGALFTKAAPLATLVYAAVYRFMNEVFLRTAAGTGTVLSIAAGLLYTVLAFRAAAFARRDLAGKAVFFASGWVAFFFGVPGSGALAMTAALLFLVAALAAFRGRHPVWAGLALVIAIGVHTSLACLVPAYLWLLARATREGRREEANVAGAAATVFLAVLLVSLVLATGSTGPVGALVSTVGSLSRASAGEILRDGANALLAGGPVTALALLLLVAGGRRRDSGLGAFAFWLVVPATAAVLLAGSRVQAGLRWEIAAATAPVFAVAALVLLGERLPGRRAMRAACLVVGALGLFHLVPILAAGVSEPVATARLRSLPLEAGRAETILGYRSLERHRWKEASERFAVAVEADSLNVIARWGYADAAIANEDFVEAIGQLDRALRIVPDNFEVRRRLAEAYVSQRWYEEAVREFERLVAERPLDAGLWLRLGYARNRAGEYEAAAIAYERAMQIDPADEAGRDGVVSAWVNEGTRRQQEGDVKTARMYYERAIDMNPRVWQAYNNLAVLEAESGDREGALATLRRGAGMSPHSPDIHLNLGLALEEAGLLEEALEHVYRARQLSPMTPGYDEVIARIEKRLEKERR
ncbi:MAG: tetratricopeptide repeat protein [Candidatus Krumholzibacteriota bacterium]|nr:tetratricopeptide repeat protein [Candidatus Krumholzibacteriota bacterium]